MNDTRDYTRRPLGYEDPKNFFEFIKDKKVRWVDGSNTTTPFDIVELIEPDIMYDRNNRPWLLRNGFDDSYDGSYWELIDPVSVEEVNHPGHPLDDAVDAPMFEVGKRYKFRDRPGGWAQFLINRDDISPSWLGPLLFINNAGGILLRDKNGNNVKDTEYSDDILPIEYREPIKFEIVRWGNPSDEEFVDADDLLVDLAILDDEDKMRRTEQPGWKKFKITLEEITD